MRKRGILMSKFVVIDLEMCVVSKNVREKYKPCSEIIQIGAVLVDEMLHVESRFECFVCPEFGKIDKFIESLTGIGSADVQDAPLLTEALERFFAWLPEEDVIAVSWSMSDRNQFRKELSAKRITIDRMDCLLDRWIDCQATFTDKIHGFRQYSLRDAIIATDIIGDDREHDGLADAYNTALLFIKMEKEDVLILNPYYDIACRDEEPTGLSFSLGDMMQGLCLQVSA